MSKLTPQPSGFIDKLKDRHAALDAEIRRMARRPGVCGTALRALKRRRLEIKDKLYRTQPTSPAR